MQIKEILEKTRKTYGSRRITKGLNNEGIKIGRKRVERIMKENNIVPITVKKFKATTNSNHDYPRSPNLVNRQFKVDAPFKAWVIETYYNRIRLHSKLDYQSPENYEKERISA